jgi:hypothetical protein
MAQAEQAALRVLAQLAVQAALAQLAVRLVLQVRAQPQVRVVQAEFKEIDMPQHQQQHLHWVMQEQ